MPNFKVAHVRQSGVDIIIIPVDLSYATKEPADQQEVMDDLQNRARAAGLAGGVVPVWDIGAGRMGFRAPVRWHPFFKSIDLEWVWANVNRELFW
jgi:hypothetical protein